MPGNPRRKNFAGDKGFAEAPTLFDAAPPMGGPPIDLPASEAAVPGAEGHRARMRARLLAAGPEALADHEMLEMVLFLALPRRDTKPIGRALLKQFGSFGAVVAAPVPELLRIEGLGEAGAAALKTIQAAALRLAKGEVMRRPVLNNWDRVIDYLTMILAHERIEEFHVLFLDSRLHLLADEVMGRGTINHAPVYPREVMKRALELQAAALILAHNHPSGDPTPSRDDIAMTRELQRAAQVLKIAIHDHVVVAGDRWVSFHQQGLL